MNMGQFSELGQGQVVGLGRVGESASADLGGVGVAIVVAGMFALLGIWLYRSEKNGE